MNVYDSIEIIRRARQDATVKVKVGGELRNIAKIDLDGDYRDLETQVVIEPAEPELIVPIVNNNGTSRQELIDQRNKVFVALGDALQLLREMTPHGRDYQTDTTGTAFMAARRQHNRRMKAVEHLRDSLRKEATAILEGR